MLLLNFYVVNFSADANNFAAVYYFCSVADFFGVTDFSGFTASTAPNISWGVLREIVW